MVLVVSKQPLGKTPTVPTFEDRLSVLEAVASSRRWLEVAVTDQRLIADVAAGYDAVIMGMDKWLQVIDADWYASAADRDTAVAGLPPVLLAARGEAVPELPARVRVLQVDAGHGPVSSTLVRAGRTEWMVEEAARFDRLTGAWTDPARYAARSGEYGTTLDQMTDPDRPRG